MGLGCERISTKSEKAILEVNNMVVDITHCKVGKKKLDNERMREQKGLTGGFMDLRSIAAFSFSGLQ